MNKAITSHRALSILLYVLAVLETIIGLVLVFMTGWLLGYSLEGLPPPNEDFVVLLLKGIGIVAVAFGYLFSVAARDPVRYVAIIDTLIFLCIAAAILEFYGAASLNIGAYFPGPYLLLRAIFQLIVAALLVWWRPRSKASA